MNLKRLLAIPALAFALVLAGCSVAVDGQDGNLVVRDVNDDVFTLVYGASFVQSVLVNDLDDHCVDGVTGADIGTANDPMDPPNAIIVNCWMDEVTYDSTEDPSDEEASWWCEVDDCGNEEMEDRVIHDATDFLWATISDYGLAEEYAAAIRDSVYDSNDCIRITSTSVTLEDICPS